MIINRQAGIGLFEKKQDVNELGLFIVDFITSQKGYLDGYADWEPCSISPDGKRLAIRTTCSHKGAYRTELTVIERSDNKVLYNTKDYFVYDVAFNATGDRLLLVADKRKPFCYDVLTQQITAQLPKQIRAYKGDLDIQQDIFFAPCETVKDTCYLFSFQTGKTGTIKLGTNALISRVKFSRDLGNIYVITETNVLYCFDRAYKIIWQTDFNYLGKAGGRINPSDIFSSEDGGLLCVYTSSTEANNWGAEYVIDSANGEIVRQIENYQFRGRVADNYFGNKVLTHKCTTLDLVTGEVSEGRVI